MLWQVLVVGCKDRKISADELIGESTEMFDVDYTYGDFQKWGYPKNGLFIREKPIYKWMIH